MLQKDSHMKHVKKGNVENITDVVVHLHHK